ncbi:MULTISPECIES: hypothetical protein [Streptomyces]|uniref:Integral membrane protein n=1 Tax=Streptomyces mutomycini TaxID=284036 RepID=A0ABW0AUD4_9ACTN|nr:MULTISPECIES: hypothetical protein [Streptomyces]KPC81636.1 membrane protein [Streptomyces sp. NRRL S-4]
MNTSPSTPTTDDTEERKAADTTAATPDVTKKAGPGDDAVPDGVAPGVTASDVTAMDVAATDAAAEDGLEVEPDPYAEADATAAAGVGTGAAAVVAAGLGIVSLSGAWTGRVAAERETLMGQIKTSGGGSAAQQISEIYGDAWHTTALVNGLFALLALIVGVFVLVRPAFGAPSVLPQAGWVRSVAVAGTALGVLGLLISVGMYLDLFVALPSAAGG